MQGNFASAFLAVLLFCEALFAAELGEIYTSIGGDKVEEMSNGEQVTRKAKVATLDSRMTSLGRLEPSSAHRNQLCSCRACRFSGYFSRSLPCLKSRSQLSNALLDDEVTLLEKLIAGGADFIFAEITVNRIVYKSAMVASVLLENEDALRVMLRAAMHMDHLNGREIDCLRLGAELVELAIETRQAACLHVLYNNGFLPMREESCIFCRLVSDAGFSCVFDFLLSKRAFWAYSKNEQGDMPIHIAARFGNFHCFLALYSSDPETLLQANKMGRSALQIIIETGRMNFFEAIYKPERERPSSILHPNYRHQHDSMTPLHWAAPHPQSLPILKLLLENTSSLQSDLRDINLQTPLHFAAIAGNIEACRLFLEHDRKRKEATRAVLCPDKYAKSPLFCFLLYPTWRDGTIFNLLVSYLDSSQSLRDCYLKPIADALVVGSRWALLDFLLGTLLQIHGNYSTKFPSLSNRPQLPQWLLKVFVDGNLKTLLFHSLKQGLLDPYMRINRCLTGSVAHDLVELDRPDLLSDLIEELGPGIIDALDRDGQSALGLAVQLERLDTISFLMSFPSVTVTSGVVTDMILTSAALAVLLVNGATFRSGSPRELSASMDYPRILKLLSAGIEALQKLESLDQYLRDIFILAFESECLAIQAVHAFAAPIPVSCSSSRGCIERAALVDEMIALETSRQMLSFKVQQLEWEDSEKPTVLLLAELLQNFGPRTEGLLEHFGLKKEEAPHSLSKSSLLCEAEKHRIDPALVEYLFL